MSLPLEVGPEAAQDLLAGSPAPVLLDVREPEELALGAIAGHTPLPMGQVPARAGGALPDRARPVVVYCAHGIRSLEVANWLRAKGWDATSMAGGIVAWAQAGLPLHEASGPLSVLQAERYARHLTIPEVGVAGQARLREASVLCVGAGGLGCPAALYLAAAGVGRLGVVDNDTVALSNLQRQVLFTTADIGRPKAVAAGARLAALNPEVEMVAREERLVAANVESLLAGWDVVLDGADNFSTRYLISDAAAQLGIPLVHGSVHRFEGQVAVFHPGGGGPCYRCLFPAPPPPGSTPSCAEAGVLGVLPGLVGTMMATEAIKVVLGLGAPLQGRLLVVDALAPAVRELEVPKDPSCQVCAPGAQFAGYQDLPEHCAG